MARLTPRAPMWDRFSKWPPGAARLALALVALVLVASILTFPRETPQPAATAPGPTASPADTPADRDTDLQLYDRIAERVGEGENYYTVAVEEQRARDFPVRPGLAVRLPTLAFLTAWLGDFGMGALALMLGAATLFAWWLRLKDEPGGSERSTVILLLLAIGTLSGLKPTYLALHEVWAGLFMALSFGLHRRHRWGLAWLAAAAALAIREHALPFVLLMGALAAWRRDLKEAIGWALLAAIFLVGLSLHLQAVSAVTTPADPLSPSWLALRGLGGWSANVVTSSALHLLPYWLAAPLVFLPLLGWAGWRTDAGLFGFLLCLGYGVFFMIAGRANNFYWALIVMPVWFIGYAFLPRSLASLWNSARDR